MAASGTLTEGIQPHQDQRIDGPLAELSGIIRLTTVNLPGGRPRRNGTTTYTEWTC
jgi:hypothetical protein